MNLFDNPHIERIPNTIDLWQVVIDVHVIEGTMEIVFQNKEEGTYIMDRLEKWAQIKKRQPHKKELMDWLQKDATLISIKK